MYAVRRNPKVRKHSEQDYEGRACTKKRRGTFQADEKCHLQAEHGTIQALPADVLLHIFGFLNLKAHRETLPLVCRQWHEVLQGPVALWRHLELDFPSAMAMAVDGSHLTPSKKFQVLTAAVCGSVCILPATTTPVCNLPAAKTSNVHSIVKHSCCCTEMFAACCMICDASNSYQGFVYPGMHSAVI